MKTRKAFLKARPMIHSAVTTSPAMRQNADKLQRTLIGGKALAFLVLLTTALSIGAQPYSIGWFKVAGGGGTSTGEVYSVSGTIGQHDAGSPLTGGGFSLAGGFWSLPAVQTPGEPTLRIVVTSPGSAMVYWPSPSTGFNLQVNTDLASANWTAPAETVQDNGTIKYIIVNPTTGSKFYRLKYP